MKKKVKYLDLLNLVGFIKYVESNSNIPYELLHHYDTFSHIWILLIESLKKEYKSKLSKEQESYNIKLKHYEAIALNSILQLIPKHERGVAAVSYDFWSNFITKAIEKFQAIELIRNQSDILL